MLGIALLSAMIVGVVRVSNVLRSDKKVILEKGISEGLYDAFEITIWLILLPPLAAALLPISYSIIGAIFFVAMHIPAIVSGSKLASRMSTGFDFQRKVGKNVRVGVWLAYAGIGLVIFNFSLLQLAMSEVR
jgi:hypothetical protein